MLQEYFSIKKKKTSEEIIIISFTQQFKNQMRLHAWFKWSAQSLIIQFGFLKLWYMSILWQSKYFRKIQC